MTVNTMRSGALNLAMGPAPLALGVESMLAPRRSDLSAQQ